MVGVGGWIPTNHIDIAGICIVRSFLHKALACGTGLDAQRGEQDQYSVLGGIIYECHSLNASKAPFGNALSWYQSLTLRNSLYTPGLISLNLPNTACLMTSMQISAKKIWQHFHTSVPFGIHELLFPISSANTNSRERQRWNLSTTSWQVITKSLLVSKRLKMVPVIKYFKLLETQAQPPKRLL